MDTSLTVVNAWQRLLRQNLLYSMPARMPSRAADADEDEDEDAVCGGSPADAPETLPMLYRSEAFAEDLCESHPQFAG